MAAILDFFPIFRHLPDWMLSVKRKGRETHRREIKLFRDHYLNTKQRLKGGTSKVVESQKNTHLNGSTQLTMGDNSHVFVSTL